MIQKKITAAALFLLGIGSLQAQQTTSSSGGEATGLGGTSSYTIGQTVYTSVSGAGGSSSQGVQQPYQIDVISGASIAEVTLEMSAYPNPTTSKLTLTVADATDLSYQLYDTKGNQIKSNVVSEALTVINLEDQPAAVYFLKVVQSKEPLKTFKIIKN